MTLEAKIFHLSQIIKPCTSGATIKDVCNLNAMTNLLPVNHRCTMHKSWLCQTCLEDHSQVSCNLITIEKELKNRKSVQLDKVKLFQDGFEEAYKDAEDCKHQYKRQIEENIEEITNYDAMVKRLQEKIKRKRIIQVQLEFRYATYDKKLERLKDKKSPYDKAITSLMTSETMFFTTVFFFL